MARFVDHAAALDVEIVDDWLFLYAPREASTLDPATWAWLFSVVAALLDKLAQWERWRDERLAPSALDPAAAVGRRARRGLGDSAVRGTDGIPPPAARRRTRGPAAATPGAVGRDHRDRRRTAADAVRPAGRVRVDHRELSN
jgi:hypothetical protein